MDGFGRFFLFLVGIEESKNLALDFRTSKYTSVFDNYCLSIIQIKNILIDNNKNNFYIMNYPNPSFSIL